MALRIWCTVKARMLCYAYLEIKKEPGDCKTGEWPLIFDSFNRRVDEYNERLTREDANGGHTNTNDAEAVTDRRLHRSKLTSLKAFFRGIRRSILELRKCRPSTPHRTKDAELQWITNVYQSSSLKHNRSLVSVESIAACWGILKDAPQIVEKLPPAILSSKPGPKPTPAPLRLAARKSPRLSANARSLRKDESSSPDREASSNGDETGKETIGTASSTAMKPHNNGECAKDDSVANGDIFDHHSRDTKKQRKQKTPRYRSKPICVRPQKRKRWDQPASNETFTVCNPSSSDRDGNLDRVNGHNEGASSTDSGTDGTGRVISRRHSHDPSNDAHSTNSSNTSNSNNNGIPHPRNPTFPMSKCANKMKVLRRKLQVAKLERAYTDLRIQELDLKLRAAKAKQELEEARDNPPM